MYFCCLEALQNAVKHAQATTMVISVEESAGELRFTAGDDGRGIDVTRARSGSGIQNMADRMAALNGSLDLDTARGGGQRRLPVPARGPELADPPIVAPHAAWRRLVPRAAPAARAFGAHQDHLVIAPAGVMNPGHPGPPEPSRSCRSRATGARSAARQLTSGGAHVPRPPPPLQYAKLCSM